MGSNCCKRRDTKKKIVLLLLGLDNAGKTRAANGLAGERLDTPVPTVGFSVINLKRPECDVKIFDLGGGQNIRGIWQRYFVDAHGIIFVIDSSDLSRLNEVQFVFENTLYSDKIAGKPLLVLANKQDNEAALDEIDLIEYLNIEQLVNKQKCPTLVQSCSATEKNNNKLDPGIQKGYDWLINNIVRNYDDLNERVERDSKEQFQRDKDEILAKMNRLRDLQATESDRKNEDLIETYSDYVKKIHDDNPGGESTDSSSISFPSVHVDYPLPERPKSAVQFVKRQLQLNPSRRRSFKTRSNKTAPVHLYDPQAAPRSARERRKDFSIESRDPHSADDCFVVGPSGDSCSPAREFYRLRKATANGDAWSHRGDREAVGRVE